MCDQRCLPRLTLHLPFADETEFIVNRLLVGKVSRQSSVFGRTDAEGDDSRIRASAYITIIKIIVIILKIITIIATIKL